MGLRFRRKYSSYNEEVFNNQKGEEVRRDKLKQFWNDNKFNIGMVVGGMAAMAGFAVGTKIARQQSQSVVDAMPFNRLPGRTLMIVPQGDFEKAPYTQYLFEAN